MATTFTLTEAQWQDLVRRMYGEAALEAALDRGNVHGVGITGSIQDMVLFLSHIAEVIEAQDGNLMPAILHLRYLADRVVQVGETEWRVECVRVEGASVPDTRPSTMLRRVPFDYGPESGGEYVEFGEADEDDCNLSKLMADGERYFLRMSDTPWQEVSEEQWRTQERACGFQPTAGFSANGVQGRIYYAGERIPADVLPPEPEPEKVEYRWFTRIAPHEVKGVQYDEEVREARAEASSFYGQAPEAVARRRAQYWRDRLGPDVTVEVLRQWVVTYPKEVVDG